MKDELIICDCGSAEHQMVLRYDDDKDLGRQVFVEIHLAPLVWYERLWQGIKYIFGYKCCYGNFEEMVLTQNTQDKCTTFTCSCDQNSLKKKLHNLQNVMGKQ